MSHPHRDAWAKGKDSPKRLQGRAGMARAARIKLRDMFTCQHCARVHDPRELEVDHIVPLSKGGTDEDDANLQSLCHPCHDVKSLRDKGIKPVVGCDADGYPVANLRS